jgi:hypothetical protein
MKKIISAALTIIVCLSVCGQTQKPQPVSFDNTAQTEQYWSKWLVNLHEPGMVIEKDSIRMNEEARQAVLDSNLRKFMYPTVYTWPVATALLKKMELKKGFWYLINLYNTDTANKKMVLESLMAFDKMLDMEKVLVSTFYTYALLDPQICTLKNGRPVITKPDTLEKEFDRLKEIIAYINLSGGKKY